MTAFVTLITAVSMIVYEGTKPWKDNFLWQSIQPIGSIEPIESMSPSRNRVNPLNRLNPFSKRCTKPEILDFGFWKEFGFWILDSRFGILAFGFWES